MAKVKKCEICKNSIQDVEHFGSFKKNVLYQDFDGEWTCFDRVFICEKCLNNLRKTVRESN